MKGGVNGKGSVRAQLRYRSVVRKGISPRSIDPIRNKSESWLRARGHAELQLFDRLSGLQQNQMTLCAVMTGTFQIALERGVDLDAGAPDRRKEQPVG